MKSARRAIAAREIEGSFTNPTSITTTRKIVLISKVHEVFIAEV